MKNSLKKFNLIWLSLLWTFLIACIINVTNGETVIKTIRENSEHIVRLHSLFLRNSGVWDSVFMKVNTWDSSLTVQWWLAIWKSHSVGNDAEFSAIGWWESNGIGGLNNWIVWWKKNLLSGKNSLIGWWESNVVYAENSVVWWWSGNKVYAHNSVIAWWAENLINWQNSVILWGQNNEANWENSLILWQKAEWLSWSFVWSAKAANPNSARIDAASGVLIWTYTWMAWVRLVIGWALSLTGTYNMEWWTWWEIRVVSGCIYAFDGENWQVMWKSSRQSEQCGGEIQACQFWGTLLYQWDTVDAYKNYYSKNCSFEKVVCSGWNLVHKSTGLTWTYYPYCYKISD